MKIDQTFYATISLAFVFLLSVTSFSEMKHSEQMRSMQKKRNETPIRITMDQLHAQGGVPRGWRFKIPKGDHLRGKEAFIKMKCFTCHSIKGEKFPRVTEDEKQPGPDLTGMGMMHPDEYFVESIINPNRVITVGEGHSGPDGLSIMPEYADTMILRELINIVAYLKSLKGEMKHMGSPKIEKEHSGPQKKKNQPN